jgi:hypothetical protein
MTVIVTVFRRRGRVRLRFRGFLLLRVIDISITLVVVV